MRPDLIIETGTLHGGSALFLASICDLLGRGQIISIDVAHHERREHPRIRYVQGSSTHPATIAQVAPLAFQSERVLVNLDSDHSRKHVLEEMKIYGWLVTPNSYLIVEDSNVNGHPVLPDHGPGPSEAIAEFLKDNTEFSVDASREKFMLTFNPGGYLRRATGSNEALAEQFHTACTTPSDVNLLLPVLNCLGRLCRHITEFGTGRSTLAWLYAKPSNLECHDLHHSADMDRLLDLARGAGVSMQFHQESTVESKPIEPTDLLLIHTLPTVKQLREELFIHAPRVRRFIVLLDTMALGAVGKDSSEGLNVVVAEFLARGMFRVAARLTQNNAARLTVLERL